ncbi:MAG: hypothetical protein QOK48_676, partial [Blastocatellia bacterium]|nr:hypothetical protein [Blastocatellia bacterium]
QRSLRLSGELIAAIIHRRDAEGAEVAQRKIEIMTLPADVLFLTSQIG